MSGGWGAGNVPSSSSMGTSGSTPDLVGSSNRGSSNTGHGRSPKGSSTTDKRVRWSGGVAVDEEDGESGSSFGLGGRHSSDSKSCGSVIEFSFGTTGTDSSGSPLVS